MTNEDEIVDQTEAPAGPAEESAGHRAKIVVKRQGAETPVEFAIQGTVTIGRFDPAFGPVDIDLADLPEGVYVSRKHARLVLEGGAFRIEDLGSSNGTFVLRDDFERVDSAELTDGTEFALGNARFVFRLEPDA